ncbi:MAG: hydantoinase/oxoprolinase family protein, partial [Alphaproteobacteria bacterium]|nr:hydantoinase/oxoprolinase family protein [Alphaproteobacteria bacterium]
KAIAVKNFPDLPVSISSEILPEFREYDRAITTVMNNYVRPIMRNYLSQMERRIRDEGMKSRLHIVRSDGGLMTAEAASERPVHTILSGPAGGVTSTVMTARKTGIQRLLAFDMGGTSTDVSVVLDGEPTISRTTEVGYFPAKVPTLDVRSVGAGGGSIADVSELTNSLRVGPRSAGAQPGPVAYGQGGTEPTVSDANATLGYLPPKLLGGDMVLDVEAARAAVADIGKKIGLEPEAAAQGILDIANETMLGALRLVTVQRGLDPREFGLVAFGGAGPMHANAMAAVLGCFPVIVPPNPGVFSALGFVQSDFKNEFAHTMIKSTVGLASDELWDEFAELERRAIAWLDEEGVTESDRDMRFSADLRYEQQGFEVTVDVPKEAVESDDLDSVLRQYHELHERLYGVRFDVPVELVVLRVVATGAMPPVIESAPADTAVENLADAVIEHHPTYFHGTWVDTPNYDRDRLGRGLTIEGPAVIRQYDATTLILPDHWAEVDEFGNLLIRPSGHATNGHDANGQGR